MKKYKAIISDIDGTLTPIVLHGVPSDKVTQTIQKAVGQGLIFSLTSSKPYFLIEYLNKHLGITSPSITDNGAVIISSKDESVLWEANLAHDEARKIIPLIMKYPLTRLSGDTVNIENPTNIPENVKIRKISIHDLQRKEAMELVKRINQATQNVAISKTISYVNKDFLDIFVSHKLATKKHAVKEFAGILKINTDEIIGIGDHFNDIPLLQACGLKVAIGNAIKEVKDMADYIAPSVEEDGLADVIEKFVLNE